MAGASCWVSSLTGGAIACVELAGDVEQVLARLGVAPIEVGGVRVRHVPVGEVRDEALVARWSADRATIMAHGGRAVVNGLMAALTAAGVERQGARPAEAEYIEAADAVEAAMLRELARACSRAGVELLLDQPRRWRNALGRELRTLPHPLRGERAADRDAVLRRLIEPALVVAVGPPNVGKSSLLNALAGRGVSVVADAPATTRDHVGALIDLGGVVVRWVDTPGIEQNAESKKLKGEIQDQEIQREAQRLALEMAARADVLVVCSDVTARIEAPPTAGTIVRVGLRADLGRVNGVDVDVSVRQGVGMERFVEVVREAAVPRRLIESPEPWRFWSV